MCDSLAVANSARILAALTSLVCLLRLVSLRICIRFVPYVLLLVAVLHFIFVYVSFRFSIDGRSCEVSERYGGK